VAHYGREIGARKAASSEPYRFVHFLGTVVDDNHLSDELDRLLGFFWQTHVARRILRKTELSCPESRVKHPHSIY